MYEQIVCQVGLMNGLLALRPPDKGGRPDAANAKRQRGYLSEGEDQGDMLVRRVRSAGLWNMQGCAG